MISTKLAMRVTNLYNNSYVTNTIISIKLAKPQIKQHCTVTN